VGSLAEIFNSSTLSVSPVNTGDIEVLAVQAQPETSAAVASLSGGGVTTWSKSIAYPGSATGSDIEIWWGKVTATGSSTITVTWSGSTPTYRELDAQEFSGSGATWSVDKTGQASSSTATSYNMASLSPTGTGELYFALAVVGGEAVAGSTSGFSYDVDDNGNLVAYGTNVSAIASPAGSQSGGTGDDSAAVLVINSGGSCGGGTTTTTAPTTTTTAATTTTTGATTTTTPSVVSATTPLLWAGQYLDSTTGLYYMRARWYDPATGEFLSVDPDVNKTLDAYGYAEENPLDGTDPSGLLAESSYCKAHPTAGSCAPKETAPPPPTNIVKPKNGVLKLGTSIDSPQVYLGGGFSISASTKITSVKGDDSINEVDLQADGRVDIGTALGTASIAPNGNLEGYLNGFVTNVQGLQVTVGINPKGSVSATVEFDKSTTFGSGNNKETVGVDTSVTFTYTLKFA
jgi:RHS repeat-associated protein